MRSSQLDGQWLVCFDQYGALPNIATIPVKEEDLEVAIAAYVKQVGDRGMLMVSKYRALGVNIGTKGILLAKEPDGKCIVRFTKQDGASQDIDITVNNDEFYVDKNNK